MTEQAAAAPADGTAQPQANASNVDNILNSFQDKPEPEVKEATETPPEPEKAWDKKTANAFAHEKGKTAKWRTTAQQERQRAEAAETELTKLRGQSAPQKTESMSPAKTGIPTKLDVSKYTDTLKYIEDRAEEIADYKMDAKFSERDSKDKETRTAAESHEWEQERIAAIDTEFADFSKEYPDVETTLKEHEAVVRAFSPQLKQALLGADKPTLAAYNLAKSGKLDELPHMSLVDAKVEIRIAQLNAPAKPQSKAPKPLQTPRGSTQTNKDLKDMSGKELLKLVSS